MWKSSVALPDLSSGSALSLSSASTASLPVIKASRQEVASMERLLNEREEKLSEAFFGMESKAVLDQYKKEVVGIKRKIHEMRHSTKLKGGLER